MTDARRLFPLRLSDEERQKLAALAKAWGVSYAVALRRILRESPKTVA